MIFQLKIKTKYLKIMNNHQILSGACNAGDRCFAVGSVEGVPFTVSYQ